MSKVKFIAVTRAKLSFSDDPALVMVNVEHITTVEEWGNLGTKLTFSNGEHLIVQESQNRVCDFIEECNDAQ